MGVEHEKRTPQTAPRTAPERRATAAALIVEAQKLLGQARSALMRPIDAPSLHLPDARRHSITVRLLGGVESTLSAAADIIR